MDRQIVLLLGLLLGTVSLAGTHGEKEVIAVKRAYYAVQNTAVEFVAR